MPIIKMRTTACKDKPKTKKFAFSSPKPGNCGRYTITSTIKTASKTIKMKKT